MKLRLVPLVAASLLCTMLAVPGAAAEASCAAADHPGGDWPSFGGDVYHTRHQVHEDVITPGRAATLATAWSWTAPAGQGSFSSTPVVAQGCVYIGSQTGWIHALNADSGKVVWTAQIEENPEVPFSSGGAGINSSLTVHDGVVYASATHYEHPYVVALDAATGDVKWTSTIVSRPGAGTHSSPLVVNGLVLAGWDTAGVEFDAEGRKTAYGGFSVIDAETGDLLKRTYTIPLEDRPEGYSGGNIWSSFAAGPNAEYAYVGTAAPYSPQAEHERTNAIIKVDIRRGSDTFGEIVDSYKGVPDTYFEATRDLPCVPLVPGSNFAEGTGPCQKLDLDFAASPNVFTDSEGRTVIGQLQKAGVYHFVDAATMEPIHRVFVGNMAMGFTPTNMGTPAVDGDTVYGAGGSHNTMFALDRETADARWRSQTVDIPLHVNPVSSANGVIYTLNGFGPMMAFDARTGFPLLTVDAPMGLGSGIAIARNTVYAAGGDEIAAFRPDPSREADAEMWTSFLDMLPTPPTTPRTDHPGI